MQSLGDRLYGLVLLRALAVVVVPAVIVVFPALLLRPAGRITEAERLKAENDVLTTLVQALGGWPCFLASTAVHAVCRPLVEDRSRSASRAVAQLGDDKLDIRLGGIDALERIVRHFEQNHGPIMEALTAFVREHAKWNGDASALPLVGADVQAVPTVLGRRPEERRREEAQPLNLIEVDLRRGRLDNAHRRARGCRVPTWRRVVSWILPRDDH